MSDQIPDETHIRHLMLYEFHKENNATVATKNICEVYGSVLKVRKCQQWFSRFRSGNVDLIDGQHTGRPVELDNDLLRAEAEAEADRVRPYKNWLTNSTLDILLFKNIFNRSGSHIDKDNGFRMNYRPKTKPSGHSYAVLWRQDKNGTRLSTALLPEMRNGCSMSTKSGRDSGCLPVRGQFRLRNPDFTQKRSCCASGGTSKEWFTTKCWSLIRPSLQSSILNNWIV